MLVTTSQFPFLCLRFCVFIVCTLRFSDVAQEVRLNNNFDTWQDISASQCSGHATGHVTMLICKALTHGLAYVNTKCFSIFIGARSCANGFCHSIAVAAGPGFVGRTSTFPQKKLASQAYHIVITIVLVLVIVSKSNNKKYYQG